MTAHEIIIRPIVSERSFSGMELNKYTFEVAKDANKYQIKDAVEEIFGVKVVRVNTLTVKPKTKRVRYVAGKTRSWKKAIVTLAEGDTITVTGTIKNYKGTIEFDKGCVLVPVDSVASVKAVIAGYALAEDAAMTSESTITGVIVARSDFVEAHPAAVGSFLTAYAASVDWVNANTADAAALIGEYGIVDAAVAEKALPYCNIVCITGAELLEKLPGYLSVLYNADPAAVGGAMPDNSFYFA